MSSDATDIGRSGLIILIGTCISMFSFYLLRIILARGLDQDKFGAIILMLSFLDIAVIGCLLGLDQGIVKQLPATDRGGSKQNTYITLSLIIVTVSSIIISGISFIFIEGIQYSIFANSVSVVFIIFTIIALPFYAIIKLSAGTLRGYQDSIFFTLVSKVALPGGSLIAAAGALLFIGSGTSVAIGILITYIITSLVGIILIFWKGWRPTLDPSTQVSSFFSFSLPLLFSASLYIVLTRADKLMIGYFTSATVTVGQYEIAVTIASLLTIFHQSFSFLLFPRISELVAENRQHEIPQVYNQATRWILIFTAPLMSIVLLRPHFFVDLFGEKYTLEPIYIPIVILAGAKFIDSILGPNGQALLGFGKSRTVLIYNTIAISLNIVLNIILIPIFGITGAAVSSLIGYTCMNFLKTGDLYFNHQFDLFDRGAILYSVMALSTAIVVSILLPNSLNIIIELLSLGIISCTAFVSGLCALYLGGEISEGDREFIKSIFDTLSKVR